jgi:acetyl esterase/lipase
MGPERRVRHRVEGLRPGTELTVEILDWEHGNVAEAWYQMGAPLNITREQTAELRHVADGLHRSTLTVGDDGVLDIDITLPAWAVASVAPTLPALERMLSAERGHRVLLAHRPNGELMTTASFTSYAPAVPEKHGMTPIAIPAQPDAIELGTGQPPDASAPEAWHSEYGSMFARNVGIATLTPFLPDPAKATGTAVIVAPGGGFVSLSMENEGWDVARALANRGIAAFVLKYRLKPTPEDLDDFAVAIRATLAGPRPSDWHDPATALRALDPQIADARAAFALVRSRASEWTIDPERVGMVGFSAGAMLTVATALVGEDAKPAFIGDIYGPLTAFEVPDDAPPLFIALAADDGLMDPSGFPLVESWRAAGRPVELHFYEQGGHGFGMYPKETTSTDWFDSFVSWMRMHGLLEHPEATSP